jgi:hypothetical protein
MHLGDAFKRVIKSLYFSPLSLQKQFTKEFEFKNISKKKLYIENH